MMDPENTVFIVLQVRSVEHLDQQHVFCAGQAGESLS